MTRPVGLVCSMPPGPGLWVGFAGWSQRQRHVGLILSAWDLRRMACDEFALIGGTFCNRGGYEPRAQQFRL